LGTKKWPTDAGAVAAGDALRRRAPEFAAVRHDRHYTLEEARAELPWVAERLAQMRDARSRLTDEDTRHALAGGSVGNGGGAAGRQVGEAFLELHAAAAAFDERDIVLRDLDRGLIDFPAIRDGREVYLCWTDDEEDIGYWHDLDAGYGARQQL
jgi:hypothetical protein